MDALATLEATVDAWSRVDLSAERHAVLDQQGLEIADHQEQSAKGREALKEVIRQFRAVPTEERTVKVGSVIRAFQAEVDALTLRQSSAETAFLCLYRSLDDAPDPLPVLRSAAAEVRRLGEGAAEADSLRQRLAEYDKEFTSLKNQDATIRRLQQQLRDVDTRSDVAAREVAETALKEREAHWKEVVRVAAAEAHEREAASAARLQQLEEELRDASRAHATGQEQLIETRAIFEQAQEAAASEVELLRGELERATASQLAAEKECARLSSEVTHHAAGPDARTSTAAEREAASTAAQAQLENLLSLKELQLSKVSAELSACERLRSAADERAAEIKASAEADLAAQRIQLERAEAQLASLPSGDVHERMRQENVELRAQLTALNNSGGAHDDPAGAAELIPRVPSS
uniref:Cux N-terminal domain-containing protein n=1 Tax=Haptolina brevifila TaxID=156173 RepID=A0A7S2DFB3_9EUKA